MEPLTQEELAAIKARVDAATAGPWTADGADVTAAHNNPVVDYVYELADSAFIAAAREDIPRLLFTIEGLIHAARAQAQDLVNAYSESLGWTDSAALDHIRRLVVQASTLLSKETPRQ